MAAEGAGARREHQHQMHEEELHPPDFGCGVAGLRQIQEVRSTHDTVAEPARRRQV